MKAKPDRIEIILYVLAFLLLVNISLNVIELCGSKPDQEGKAATEKKLPDHMATEKVSGMSPLRIYRSMKVSYGSRWILPRGYTKGKSLATV